MMRMVVYTCWEATAPLLGIDRGCGTGMKGSAKHSVVPFGTSPVVAAHESRRFVDEAERCIEVVHERVLLDVRVALPDEREVSCPAVLC